MLLDHANPATAPGITARFWTLVGSGSIVGLFVWIAASAITLRFALPHPSWLDYSALLFPPIVLAAGLVAFRPLAAGPRVDWAFKATLATCALTTLLVVFVGIPVYILMGAQP